MSVILVTGGTGTLGRALVPQLLTGGHEVRVLSRRASPRLPADATAFQGDVRTGIGIERATRGADVVIHAASSPTRKVMQTEVDGARQVAAAAREAGAHLVYVSIVGVDAHRYFYYRAKRAAELVIADSGARWTVQRATQFHDLIDRFLSSGWFIRTPDLRFQPVDVADVARRLVELADGQPLGMATDLGGPDISTIEELAAAREAVTRKHTRLVRVPVRGFFADFDAGRHLAPDHRDGTVTWQEWLRQRQMNGGAHATGR
jgi:uncharacterized protein YbjT (DUF2867 family)